MNRVKSCEPKLLQTGGRMKLCTHNETIASPIYGKHFHTNFRSFVRNFSINFACAKFCLCGARFFFFCFTRGVLARCGARRRKGHNAHRHIAIFGAIQAKRWQRREIEGKWIDLTAASKWRSGRRKSTGDTPSQFILPWARMIIVFSRALTRVRHQCY